MPDQFTPTPVKTRENGDVVANLVDVAGINRQVVNAEGEAYTSADLRQVAGAPTDVGNGNAGPGTQRVVIADDNEPIQVALTTTDDPNALENAVWTRLSDGTTQVGTRTNPLVVTQEGGPGAVADSGLLTAATVAAGASADLATAPVGAGGARVVELTASSSVRLRVEVRIGTAAHRVFFVREGDHLVYRPTDADTLRAAGAEVVTLRVTNMDNAFAADVYGSVTTEALA